MLSVSYTHCAHFQGEGIVRIGSIGVEEDGRRWMLVSSRGRVSIYDETFKEVHNTFTLPLLTSSSSFSGHNGLVPVAKKHWITDAVYMAECNTLVVASSGRSLHFFTTAVTPFVARYVLADMKDTATCLAYYGGDGGQPVLCIGDEEGHVFVLHFLKHTQWLFKKVGVDDVQHIYWRDLYLQAGSIQLDVLPGGHKGAVVQVDLKRCIHQMVVSSGRTGQPSLLIRHVAVKKPAIIFRTGCGTTCFDLDEVRGVLATGSSDTKIRMWSATANAKPWMTLSGHPATISAVSLQQAANFLFSLCERSELRHWDLNEANCIRTIRLEFSSGLRKRADPFTKKLLLVQDDYILVACGDQIASVHLSTGTHNADADADASGGGPAPSNQRRCDEETCASEEKIPIHFRETLLDFGACEEDPIFDTFAQDLKRIFSDFPSAERYLAEAHPPPEAHPTSGNVYDWEDSIAAGIPANLIPLNQFKLREFRRMDAMKQHVDKATPFCGLQLPQPKQVDLPPSLPVTQRMRKQGIRNWTDFRHLRSADADVFGEGFSDLSSARSSLASSVLSYYRQKKVKDAFRIGPPRINFRQSLSASSFPSSVRSSSPDASPRTDRTDHST